MKKFKTIWTKVMRKDLKRLWSEGKSAKACVAYMAKTYKVSLTTNSIIGKVHREGFSRRGAGLKKAAVGQLVGTPVAPKPGRKVKVLAKADVIKPVRHGLVFAHGATCQYIFGEPVGRHFCGKPSVLNPFQKTGAKSWCANHINAVYQPQKRAA